MHGLCVPRTNTVLYSTGDRRQHEAVEAGKPFAQLQEAGMKTISLDQIVRQKEPELRQVVEQLARGEVGAAVKNLDSQGRVHEFRGREERIDAIAKEYAKSPENTLVVSPDNRSRAEINQRIHAELQRHGVVGREEHRVETLVPRQDLSGSTGLQACMYLLLSRTLSLQVRRDVGAAQRASPAPGVSVVAEVGAARQGHGQRPDYCK